MTTAADAEPAVVDPDDHLAIVGLVHRYAHAVDAGAVGAVTELFADDARLHFASTGVDLRGRAAIAEFYDGALGGSSMSSTHLMGNTVIDPDGADRARVTTSAVVYRADPGAASITIRGLTYVDLVRRTGAGWRFAERVHRLHWEGAAPGGPKATERS